MSLFSVIDQLAQPFVHKRIIGGVKGFVTSGFSPTGAAAGFLTSGGGGSRDRGFRRPMRDVPPRRPVSRSVVARPSVFSAAEKQLGRELKFASADVRSFKPVGGSCPPFMRPDPVTGECKFFIGDRPGRDTRPLETGPGVPVGDAVMGQFGAALEPGSRIIDRAVCLRGMVLAVDGLCYNRSQIRNNQRMWPKGRKPLLTGGEMRAISIAATAGRRMERASKRLQKIGLMKKPPPRRKITSGPTEHHHH